VTETRGQVSIVAPPPKPSSDVVPVDAQYITIHYLGWPIKWVETLPRESDRLAPQLSRTGPSIHPSIHSLI
jgi:hypothetical protein